MKAILISAIVAAQAGAQASNTSVPDLNVGALVRLETRTVAGKFVTGELRAANQGFVAMSVSETETDISVPWTRILSLHRFTHRDQVAGVATGLLVGGAAALVAAPAVATYIAFPLGGAALGWKNAPRRWTNVAWRPTMDTVMLEGEATRLKLPEGTEIIVRARRQGFKARAFAVTDDSIFFTHDGKRRGFAWRETVDLRIRAGRDRPKGAAVGLLIGGVVGGVVSALSEKDAVVGTRRMEQIGRGMLIGAAGGFAIGLPGWTRIPFPVQ